MGGISCWCEWVRNQEQRWYGPDPRAAKNSRFTQVSLVNSTSLPDTYPAEPYSVERVRSPRASNHWIELAALENTLLAFEPTRRIVPTTITKITASITAYSAISCP